MIAMPGGSISKCEDNLLQPLHVVRQLPDEKVLILTTNFSRQVNVGDDADFQGWASPQNPLWGSVFSANPFQAIRLL